LGKKTFWGFLFENFLRRFDIQYVKKMFETNKGNFSGSKPIIGRKITFNPEEIGAFGLEQFFTYCKELQKSKNGYRFWRFYRGAKASSSV
jgi:hypothetical protein